MAFNARLSLERAEVLYQSTRLHPLANVPIKRDFAITYLPPINTVNQTLSSLMLNMKEGRVSQVVVKEIGKERTKEIRVYEIHSEGPLSDDPSIVSLGQTHNAGELESGYPLIVGAGKDEMQFPPAAFAVTHQGNRMVRVDCFHPSGIFVGLDILKKPHIGTELGHLSINKNLKWLNNVMPTRSRIIANALLAKKEREENEWCKETSLTNDAVMFPVRISLEGEFLDGGEEVSKEYFIAYFGYKYHNEVMDPLNRLLGMEDIGFDVELSRFAVTEKVGSEVLGTNIFANAFLPKGICSVADASIEYFNRPIRGNMI